MKEETLTLNVLRVYLTYAFLGLIVGLGLVLILFQMDPSSPFNPRIVYYSAALNGVLGLIREKQQDDLQFSRRGLRINFAEIVSWNDIELTQQYSSKLFGKYYLVKCKKTQLQTHLCLNWWVEDELIQLINTYTPQNHSLRKLINAHEFGLASQLKLSTKLGMTGVWKAISFDYVFLVLLCAGVMSNKFF